MGKMRSKVVPCSYEATESQFKPREFDSKAQGLDHFGTFFVKAARSSQQETLMEGHAGGSKGSAFAACQEHVGLFCTIPSDPVVVVVVVGG